MNLTVRRDPFTLSTSPEKPGHPNLLWWLLLGLIFLAGAAVRLYDLGDPPLDFHPTRQIHSALIARGMDYQQRLDIPAWQRDMAVSQWQMEGEIEPQIFERLTAWIYGQVGAVDLRIPRLIAIFCWMVGAVFLTWLAVDLVGLSGALAVAWFYLLWPYGVIASRSFQPEPALVMLLAVTFWASLRWEKRGGWRWAAAVGLLAGLAIYVKVVALFFIGPALLALTLTRTGSRWYRSPQVWLIAVLALLPYAIYHIDGVYIHGYLASQFSLRFFPQMWADPAFYLRWISNLGRVLPFEMLLAALLGAFLVRQTPGRVLLLAQWAGYFVYGMALSHHISTHDYYHLLLFPALALGIGGIVSVIIQNIRGPFWLTRLVAVGVLLAALMINGYNARNTLKRFDAAKQAGIWEEIGQTLGHGASVAALVPDYGVGLKYWAWINPSLWLTEDDIAFRESVGQQVDFSAWFEDQAAGKDYFVVTMFDELDHQQQLKKLLYDHYVLFKQTPDYVIFDLRQKNSQ
ncbi:MAG: glycosyltransferase family 39 protein [Anaerolineaceae bacterium]|nr:glycosyltransferase family 39 protein [Anaerolineaceae bacterium]